MVEFRVECEVLKTDFDTFIIPRWRILSSVKLTKLKIRNMAKETFKKYHYPFFGELKNG